jgi:Zn-dependent peptidase ImmA (M78 family)/transcriptional regulator with XRE-family HTH domain
MNAINNNMLILARESRGITQHELVSIVPNLNQGNYSKMEKGLLNVPSETLNQIATILDYPLSFFYRESVRTPISSFYYRRRITIPKKSLTELEAKLNIFRIIVDELLESVDVPEYKLPIYQVSDSMTPSEIAVRLRDFLKLPTGPIKNLVKVLESAGIIVYFIKSNVDKFDGITLISDKGQPIIFINSSLPNDRKRFTISHEVFHLIAHIPFSPLPYDRDEEREANEFAGEFLMPYLECRYDLQDLRYSQLDILKTYWKVSKGAIIRRAKDIFAITDEKYKYLNIELSRRGERKKEFGIVDIDEPTLIKMIIDIYLDELHYSKNDLKGTLSLKDRDFSNYFYNILNDVPIVSAKRVIEFKPKTA